MAWAEHRTLTMKNPKALIPLLLLILAAAVFYLPTILSGTQDEYIEVPSVETPKNSKTPVVEERWRKGASEVGDNKTNDLRKRIPLTETQKDLPQGVSGQVVSKTGNFLPKAEVFLMKTSSSTQKILDLIEMHRRRQKGLKPRGNVAAAILTDAQGRFHLGVAPSTSGRPYELQILAEGHVLNKRKLFIKEGAWSKLGTIRLEPGRPLQGRVISADNKAPIADAIVQVMSPSLDPTLQAPGHFEGIRTTTGAQGFYKLEGLTVNQPLTVTVSAKGFAKLQLKLEIKSDEFSRREVFELARGYDIEGFVLDPDNKPIAGAIVRATPFSQNNPTYGECTSDSEGHFLLFGLADGQYSVSAEAEGYGRNEKKPVKAGETQVTLALERLAAVRVSVVNKKGKAVTSYRLELRTFFAKDQNFGRSAMPAVEVRNSKGEKLLRGIPPGNYVFEVNAAFKYAKTYSTNFIVTAGSYDEVPVRIVMNMGGSLTGRVVDQAGNPIANASIATLDTNYQDNPIWEIFGRLVPPRNTHRSVPSDKQGRFRIDKLTPGKYQIKVGHPSFTRKYKKGFEISEDQTMDIGNITLERGGRISGIVFYMGSPLANAEVSITSKAGPPENRQQQNNIFVRVITDENGRYKAGRPLPAGTYEINAVRLDIANPLLKLVDMQKSRVELELFGGQEARKDLHIPK